MNRTSVYATLLAGLVCIGFWFFIIKKDNIKDNNKTMQEDKIEVTKIISMAVFHTNKGDIEIEFFGDKTPITVASFVKLAGEGFYDGIKFHRVIKDFMIQSGDPFSKDDTKKSMWGTGGPGYSFADEIIATNSNEVGTISMANSGPNTNGSQFFFNVKNNDFLNTKHTVFGKVVKGLDIVIAISVVPTDGADKPLEPVIIKSISLK